MTEFHRPVMLGEVLHWLEVEPADLIVDMTFGGGGYSRGILQKLGSEGKLVAFDRDRDAVDRGLALLGDDARLTLHHAPFSESADYIALHGGGHDGAVFDLGVSSHQLDEAARGFSFKADGPLDMRMDGSSSTNNAAHLVNTASVQELTVIFREYGEEKKARAVARAIEARRALRPFERTLELAELVEQVVGYPRIAGKTQRPKHPATRCFQALRIAVNDELGQLRRGLENAVSTARNGARVAVVTYHSLEDRLVKNFFLDRAGRCHCPRHQPVCTCGAKSEVKLLSRRALKPSEGEVAENRRARSALLRVVEKV